MVFFRNFLFLILILISPFTFTQEIFSIQNPNSLWFDGNNWAPFPGTPVNSSTTDVQVQGFVGNVGIVDSSTNVRDLELTPNAVLSAELNTLSIFGDLTVDQTSTLRSGQGTIDFTSSFNSISGSSGNGTLRANNGGSIFLKRNNVSNMDIITDAGGFIQFSGTTVTNSNLSGTIKTQGSFGPTTLNNVDHSGILNLTTRTIIEGLFDSTGTINANSFGNLEISSTGRLRGATVNINGSGIVRFLDGSRADGGTNLGGSDTSTSGNVGFSSVDVSGIVDVNSGSILSYNGTNNITGTINNSGQIQTIVGSITTASGAVNNGTIDAAGSGSFRLNGGTVSSATIKGTGFAITGNGSSLTDVINDSILTVSNGVTVDVSNLTNNGTIAGSGTLNFTTNTGINGVVNDATLQSGTGSLNINGATLNNATVAKVGAGSVSLSGVTANNSSLSGTISVVGNFGASTFNNTTAHSGTLNLNSGATIQNLFNSTGTINVQSFGNLTVSNGGILRGATVSGSGVVNFQDGSRADSGTNLAHNNVNTSGNVVFSSVNLSGTLNNNGSLVYNGTNNITGTINNSGQIETIVGSITTVSGTVNNGTINAGGSFRLDGGAVSSATIEGTGFTVTGNGSSLTDVINDGTLTVNNGATADVSNLTNNGTIAGSGTLNFITNNTINGIINDVTLQSGSGQLTVDGATVNNATLQSGNSSLRVQSSTLDGATIAKVGTGSVTLSGITASNSTLSGNMNVAGNQGPSTFNGTTTHSGNLATTAQIDIQGLFNSTGSIDIQGFGNVLVNNGATLRGAAVNVTGIGLGSGNLSFLDGSKADGGVTLASSSGSTINTSGTVVFSSVNLSGTLSNNGSLVYNGTNNITGTINNSDQIRTIVGSITTVSGTVNNGTIDAAGSATFRLNGGTVSSATIEGTGFAIIGNGSSLTDVINDGTLTVNNGATADVNGFTSSIAGTIAGSGTLNFTSGNNTIDGSVDGTTLQTNGGNLTIRHTLQDPGAPSSTVQNATLSNVSGTLKITGKNINNSTLSGTIEIFGSDGGSTLNNTTHSGTLELTAAATILNLFDSNNAGTIDVKNFGNLIVSNGATLKDTTVDVAVGGIADFQAGSSADGVSLVGDNISTSGNVSFNNVDISGIVNVNNSSILSYTGASNDLTGTINNSASVQVNAGSILNISGVLDGNPGNGSTTLIEGGAQINLAGGSVANERIQGSGNFNITANGSSLTNVLNQGNVAIGSGITTTFNNVTNNSSITNSGILTGTIDNAGNLTVSNGGVLRGAVVNNIGGSSLDFEDGSSADNGTNLLGSNGNISTSGNVNFADIDTVGTITVNNSSILSYNGNSSQAGTLNNFGTLNNSGTLTNSGTLNLNVGSLFNNDGSFTSTNTITNQGNLVVNGTFAAELVNEGRLSGSGMINGNVEIADGGTLAPGNVPDASLTVGNATFAGGGIFEFELTSAISNPGIDQDLLVANILNITATQENPFTIDVTAPFLADFNPLGGHLFTIVQTTSEIIGFDPTKFIIALDNFDNNLASGVFELQQSGNNLNLAFVPVPEPSTWLMMLLGLLSIFRFRRKKA